MNLALYSSDWTPSNLQHKILLLHAMRMNNAENLRLQVTKNRIVNFKMFTDVRMIFFSFYYRVLWTCLLLRKIIIYDLFYIYSLDVRIDMM